MSSGVRTFRAGIDRWMWAVTVAGWVMAGAALVFVLRPPPGGWGLFGDRWFDPNPIGWLWWGALAFVLSGAAWSGRQCWAAWTAVVVLDDRGLRWRDEEGRRAFAWEEIGSLQHGGPETDPRPVIVRWDGGRYTLPFVTPALYRALKERVNPLPPDVEARMGVSQVEPGQGKDGP